MKEYYQIGTCEQTENGYVFSSGYSGQGMIFKDDENYEKDWSLPCYVPEGEFDNDENVDKEYYTHESLLEMCFNNHKLCDAVFSSLSWEYPETLLDEWEMDADFRWCFDFVKVGATVKWNDPSGETSGVYKVLNISECDDWGWSTDLTILIGNGITESEVNLCELEVIEFNENELYDILCNMYSPIQSKCEDEPYTIAHDMFMDNVAKMELKYPFLQDHDNDGELWYDSIREDVMSHYMTKMS